MIKGNWAPACAGATRALGAAATMALVGCAIGPAYERPQLDLPREYGGVQATVPASPTWWKVFSDPVLDRLVDEALANSHDLRAAAERIEQARALLGVARA